MSMTWNRLLQTTTPMFLRDAEVNIVRNRKVLAMAESNGRIRYNCSGTKLNWKIEYRMPPLVGFSDGDNVDFDQKDKFKTAELEYRSQVMTDAMSEMVRLQNNGEAAIVKEYSETITKLIRAVRDQFGDEVYKDGNTSANSRALHGIESFMGTAGSPYKLTNGFVLPEDAYAGLSTKPQTYGGNWSGTGVTAGATAWPVGAGDAHFDFFSPVLVNYTDPTAGVWSAATKTWINTNEEAMRKGLTKSRRSAAKQGMLDLILLNEEMFEQYKTSNSSRQQIPIQPGGPGTLLALGFTDGQMFDGCNLSSEYGIPASAGYGINSMEMELCSLQGQLFTPHGPEFDKNTQFWNFWINFFGNFRWNPKFFVKFYPWG